MAGFVYFIPKQPVTRPEIEAAALGYAFDSEVIARRECSGPPDAQGSGTALLRGESKLEIGVFTDRQTWTASRSGHFWIGYWNEAPPQPADLARPELHGSYGVRLSDGRYWRIPTAILADGSSPLPKDRKLLPNGEIERCVKPAFAQLYLYADQVREGFKTRGSISLKEQWAICVAALRTNYRISDDEVNILRLLDDQNSMAIMATLVDYANWPDSPLNPAAEGTSDGR